MTPEIHGNEWATGTVHKTVDSGRFPSLVKTPDGHLASTFYHYDQVLLGSIYMVNLDHDLKGTVTVAVDSIAMPPDEGVYVDLAIDQESSWHISYRNARQGRLWYGRADSSVVVGIGGIGDPEVPIARGNTLELFQNLPSPFNPMTEISFTLPGRALVTLSVYDVAGRLVRTLVENTLDAGLKKIPWDGKDSHGDPVSSGVYFYRLTAGDRTLTKKMLLLK